LAQLLFDELNHTLTPGGHRVVVYLDSHRLIKEARSVAATVNGITRLQGCQLWSHHVDLQGIPLTHEQESLIGKGCGCPAVDLNAVPLSQDQKKLCHGGLDRSQVQMLKAQIRAKKSDFHEIIDRAVDIRAKHNADFLELVPSPAVSRHTVVPAPQTEEEIEIFNHSESPDSGLILHTLHTFNSIEGQLVYSPECDFEGGLTRHHNEIQVHVPVSQDCFSNPGTTFTETMQGDSQYFSDLSQQYP
jgi:hypothetical protein